MWEHKDSLQKPLLECMSVFDSDKIGLDLVFAYSDIVSRKTTLCKVTSSSVKIDLFILIIFIYLLIYFILLFFILFYFLKNLAVACTTSVAIFVSVSYFPWTILIPYRTFFMILSSTIAI